MIRLEVVVHGVSDDFFGAAVWNGRQIQPSLAGGDVGDIADEFLSGPFGCEVAPDRIRDGPGFAVQGQASGAAGTPA